MTIDRKFYDSYDFCNYNFANMLTYFSRSSCEDFCKNVWIKHFITLDCFDVLNIRTMLMNKYKFIDRHCKIEISQVYTMKQNERVESESIYRFFDLVERSRDFTEWHKNPSFVFFHETCILKLFS